MCRRRGDGGARGLGRGGGGRRARGGLFLGSRKGEYCEDYLVLRRREGAYGVGFEAVEFAVDTYSRQYIGHVTNLYDDITYRQSSDQRVCNR